MPDETTITRTLAANGFRLTGPRRILAELLASREGPFSANDLLDEARRRNAGLGRATVFRALDRLEELGLVERVDLLTGEHAYVTCEPAHHHHLICSSCGTSVEIPDGPLRRAIAGIERETGFRVDAHRLELFGACPTCRTERRDR